MWNDTDPEFFGEGKGLRENRKRGVLVDYEGHNREIREKKSIRRLFVEVQNIIEMEEVEERRRNLDTS